MKNLMVFKKLCLFLLFLFVLACEYHPTGKNHTVVEPPNSNPEITLPSEDATFELRGYVDINYNIDLDGTIFGSAEFLLDGSIIWESYSNYNNTLSFDSRDYPDGDHTLTLRTLLYSNSGSLAASLHMEGYIEEQSWTLQIDNSDLEGINITDVYEYDGRLKIDWEQYEGLMFEKYELRICGKNVRQIEIYDRNTTSYIDSIFANGEIWGSVKIYAHGDMNQSGEGFSIDDYQPRNLICSPDDNDCPILEWDECIYYANCAGYNVCGSRPGYAIIATIPAYDVTTWLDAANPLVFGERRGYYVEAINADNGVYNDHNYLYISDAYIGTVFSDRYSEAFFNLEGSLITIDYEIMNFYDLNSLELLNTMEYTGSTSKFRFVESSNELFRTDHYRIRILNSYTGVEEELILIDELFDELYNPELIRFAVSEEKYFCRIRTSGESYGYIVDRATNEKLIMPDIGFHLEISPNSEYALDSQHLYHITEDSVEILHDLDYNYEYIFRNNEEFVSFFETDVHVRRIVDFSTVVHFQSQFNLYKMRIAPDTGYLQCNGYGEFLVYDIDAGSVEWQLQGHYTSGYDLIGDRIFSTNGIYTEYQE